MNDLDAQKRKDAVRALINIALVEGAVLMTVVLIYLNTKNVTHLVSGVAASALIFGPMFFRWFKAHGEAMKPKPNSVEAEERHE